MQSNLNTHSFSIFCSRKLSDVWFLNDIHVKQKTSILIWQRFLFCEADHFAPSMLSAAYWLSDFCNVRDEPKRTKPWISSTRHAEQNQWVARLPLFIFFTSRTVQIKVNDPDKACPSCLISTLPTSTLIAKQQDNQLQAHCTPTKSYNSVRPQFRTSLFYFLFRNKES